MSATQHVFVALYSGQTIAEARLIAASSAPELVELAAKKMLAEIDQAPNAKTDPVLAGRRHALRLVKSEAS